MKFKIMGKKGDAVFEYDTIEMQKVKFQELQGSGMLPMVRGGGGSRVLKEFEPDAEEVIWMPRIMGG